MQAFTSARQYATTAALKKSRKVENIICYFILNDTLKYLS